jgi:putative spermidine/putrescine transport system permease protein
VSRAAAWALLPTAPFFAFVLAFLLIPSASLFVGSFQNPTGGWTLDNIIGLGQPSVMSAYSVSIELSLVTAIGGGLGGFALAWAVVLGRLPTWMRSALLTFSGVASNFAGIPLAFAFIATFGRTGMVTALLTSGLGLNLYDHGFSLYGFWGLSLVYLYFELPLMVLILTPALDGLKPEWTEAAHNLGASTGQFWRFVALPTLLPSILGAMILLFGNAFGAYATAYALTGGSLNLAPIVVGAQIRGDVLHNQNLGYALAFGMVVIMTVSLIAYSLMQRRSERWLR